MAACFSSTRNSPLVSGALASLVGTVTSSEIINGYSRKYGIDVSEYFGGINEVCIYECEATGYKFYYPFSVTGKEDLYKQLQKYAWNYKDEKWEYTTALKHLKPGSRILDVGCGRGAFIKITSRVGMISHGLELNKLALLTAKSNGLSVGSELIGDHATAAPEAYDAVCSFQVLEHIAEVRQFIVDCIRALKPGGLLIFGVPNNDAFLRYDPGAVLNMPPHHMGLWGRQSLLALAGAFPLTLKALLIEPLAELDWYTSVMERRYITNGWLRSLYYRLGLSHMFKLYVSTQVRRIPGHTILAIYEKN